MPSRRLQAGCFANVKGLKMDHHELVERLRKVLKGGLSKEALAHAQQVAFVAGILHGAFAQAGYRCTIVGGSAIELHAPGVYLSGDIDLVVEQRRTDAEAVEAVFESLGFERWGRHWRLGDLFVEVPSRSILDPTEMMRVGPAVFEVVSKEVVLADRIVGFRQWDVLAWGQQAVDLLAAFGSDMDTDWLLERLSREGSLDALEPLKEMAASDDPVTEESLRKLLLALRS